MLPNDIGAPLSLATQEASANQAIDYQEPDGDAIDITYVKSHTHLLMWSHMFYF